MLKIATNLPVGNSVTESRPRMLVASKAAFLENYLVVSTWILNRSSIEYHEKKHQRFSLSDVRISGAVKNQFSTLNSLQSVVTGTQNPPNRLSFEPEKFCNEQTVLSATLCPTGGNDDDDEKVEVESIISNLSESLRIKCPFRMCYNF